MVTVLSGNRDSSGCLWSAQLNLDWRRSHALGSEDASHWGQKKTWRSKSHDVLLKKVTSELHVLQMPATAWISWHVARLFAWSKLWSVSCHSEHGKKRLNDCCATFIDRETFNFSRCQTSMKSAKSANPSRWNHSMFTFPIFSSYPTTAFPCLESYSWGPDMVSSQMLETSGTASEFLAQLGMSNSKQKSDHPRTPVTRIHHFNTRVVFWYEFYISNLKSLLIDIHRLLIDSDGSCRISRLRHVCWAWV